MTIDRSQANPEEGIRDDRYIHSSFDERSCPDLVQRALRAHAIGYTSMAFVSSEAVTPDGVLASSIDHARGEYIDYYLLENPQNPDDMATMRKINIPPGGSIDDLPAYQLTKDSLTEEGAAFLKELGNQGLKIVEIAGLARTPAAPAMATYEMLRDVLQASLGQNEAWFFSIVSSTLGHLIANFGKDAFNIIGGEVKIQDPRVNKSIQLAPTILLPDKLFDSMIHDIDNAANQREQLRILRMFLYFMRGLSPARAGEEAYVYKEAILKLTQESEVNL